MNMTPQVALFRGEWQGTSECRMTGRGNLIVSKIRYRTNNEYDAHRDESVSS